MKERKETINLITANLFAIAIFFIAAIFFGVLFLLRWKLAGHPQLQTHGGLFFYLALILGIAVHELIHGITWALLAPNRFKSISFGVIWKMLTPYCHCSDPLKVSHYILGALTPLIILGIIPAIISLINLNPLWYLYGILYISAAAGDIMVAWRIRHEDPQHLVLDHPTEAGYIIYEKD